MALFYHSSEEDMYMGQKIIKIDAEEDVYMGYKIKKTPKITYGENMDLNIMEDYNV